MLLLILEPKNKQEHREREGERERGREGGRGRGRGRERWTSSSFGYKQMCLPWWISACSSFWSGWRPKWSAPQTSSTATTSWSSSCPARILLRSGTFSPPSSGSVFKSSMEDGWEVKVQMKATRGSPGFYFLVYGQEMALVAIVWSFRLLWLCKIGAKWFLRQWFEVSICFGCKFDAKWCLPPSKMYFFVVSIDFLREKHCTACLSVKRWMPMLICLF